MRMAAEAIQDSERMMLGRQRLDNVANIEVGAGITDPMKQSLDVENKLVWDRTNGEDFSVFAQNKEDARRDNRNSNLK